MIPHAPNDAADEKLYECGSCLSRTAASSRPTACPECDGSLRNIAVPRE
ncbi:MAG: rubrerythrin-like domain-containing protein [Halolamina sp.]